VPPGPLSPHVNLTAVALSRFCFSKRVISNYRWFSEEC
jgi:hypothetical protein